MPSIYVDYLYFSIIYRAIETQNIIPIMIALLLEWSPYLLYGIITENFLVVMKQPLLHLNIAI